MADRRCIRGWTDAYVGLSSRRTPPAIECQQTIWNAPQGRPRVLTLGEVLERTIAPGRRPPRGGNPVPPWGSAGPPQQIPLPGVGADRVLGVRFGVGRGGGRGYPGDPR